MVLTPSRCTHRHGAFSGTLALTLSLSPRTELQRFVPRNPQQAAEGAPRARGSHGSSVRLRGDSECAPLALREAAPSVGRVGNTVFQKRP